MRHLIAGIVTWAVACCVSYGVAVAVTWPLPTMLKPLGVVAGVLAFLAVLIGGWLYTD